MAKKSEVLVQDMKGKWQEISDLRNQVVEEDRSFKQDEKDKIEKALDEVRDIEVQIEKERKEESLHDEIDHFDQMFAKKPPQQKAYDPKSDSRVREAMSIGQKFVESAEWKEFKARVAPQGRIPESMKGLNSRPVPIESKALITGSAATSAGAFVVAEDTGIYEAIGRYQLTLRQLIDVRTTLSDTVEYVRQTAQVTQASPTQESNVTDYDGATGEISGEKPEGTSTWVRESSTVKTLPVWIPATKRALSDAAQLRGLIDSELRDDVNEELEDQLLNGNGVGENFTGLANVSGTLVQAYDTDIANTARQAITHLLINGRQLPTAWLLNPQDWEAFDLLQDSNGQYYWGGPTRMGPPTLWGVPVSQNFFLTEGTGWLGNWRKMVLWDREEATISVSDSHEDFFIRNMVAILCELRAAMAVIRPSAFVSVDLTAGS